MKGKSKIIGCLNSLLSDELLAINQYIIQSEIYENWGYKKLHDAIKKQAIEEMGHAEKLISRIIQLEGMPAVNTKPKIHIGKTIPEQIEIDRQSERDAVKLYNAAIRLATNEEDEITAMLLRSILSDEEKHFEWLETQAVQMTQLGEQEYLAHQLG